MDAKWWQRTLRALVPWPHCRDDSRSHIEVAVMNAAARRRILRILRNPHLYSWRTWERVQTLLTRVK